MTRLADIHGRARRRLSGEAGLGLVEVMITVFVLSVGLLGSVGAITSARNGTETARRTETATHIAQQQIERMRMIPYNSLHMTGPPSNPPGTARAGWYYVYFFLYDGSNWEYLAEPANQNNLASTDDGAPQVAPKDTSATDASIPAGYTVYRYVTYRTENCGTATCNGTSRNSKRIIVAVTADPSPAHKGVGPKKPIWTSSIVTDPDAL